ncbi:MAG: glycosyltransferase family 9 protein [Planctomycetes bacterium]|nr:glycosyltransferase family 9 protein [Planctomycetota bacterium]MCW8134692.1 glycosyltransferase family 9 protein [Planctomycetota bacterium]
MPRLPRLTTVIALGWAKRQARRFPAGAFEPLVPDTRARILVVNTTGIGDTIFCTAPVADLRESFPNAEIDLFVDRRRVALLENNPRVTRLVHYYGKYKRMRATIRELRAREYDVAIIQHAGDPDVVPLVAMARPKAIIGYESHTFSNLYAVKLPPADRAGGAHTIDARLALTRAAGARGEHWHTELYPDDADRAQAAEVFHEFELKPGEPVAMNIGGSLASKRWPITHWAALARVLAEKGRRCVFVGGPEDQILAEMIREHLPPECRASFAVGRTPFMASAALLKLCAVHVTGDTGLMQAGLALDVPTLALFGPDDARWTGPYPKQANAAFIQADFTTLPEGYDRKLDREGALMKTIGVDQVVDALKAFGV